MRSGPGRAAGPSGEKSAFLRHFGGHASHLTGGKIGILLHPADQFADGRRSRKKLLHGFGIHHGIPFNHVAKTSREGIRSGNSREPAPQSRLGQGGRNRPFLEGFPPLLAAKRIQSEGERASGPPISTVRPRTRGLREASIRQEATSSTAIGLVRTEGSACGIPGAFSHQWMAGIANRISCRDE